MQRNIPLNSVAPEEVQLGDKRRGSQAHNARRVRTPWKAEPFGSGAEAADYALVHGGTWVLLIAARAGESWNHCGLTDEQLLRVIRKNVQQNILSRCRRNSAGFGFV